MCLIRAKIIIDGDVQKVGYRDFVQKVARKLGAKGYVENLRDGNVQIICEAEESVLKDFVEGINVKEDLIKVGNVQIAERFAATGEFEFFEIKYGKLEDELGERLGTAVEYARTTRSNIQEMHEDIKGTRVDIREMHADLKSSIKEMHEDVKGTRLDIKEMHKDIKGTRLDIREMHKGLRDGIEGMHKDLKGTIGSMHRDLKNGAVGVQGEISGMRHEMNERFEDMAKRYDAISAELVRTRVELTRAVDGLLKLIEEFIRQRRQEEIQ